MSFFKYETRWGSNETGARTPYQTVLAAGRLRFHIFHRGDADPDPHDHMWDFWTFPLTTYFEKVYYGNLSITKEVRAFRLHRRDATHKHIVLGRSGWASPETRKVYTIVWVGKKKREWGFWKESAGGLGARGFRYFVPWREYVFGKEDK